MNSLNNLSVKEVNERLQEATLSLFEKKRYKEFLGFIGQFPAYSSNNLTLIHLQDPEATMVCGYKEWERYGRHVVAGGKGMKIFAPKKEKIEVKKKDANGNVIYDANGDPVMESKMVLKGYTLKSVFDVSQTAGKPVPSITALFSGRVDGYTELLSVLENVSPVSVTFMPDGASGFSDKTGIISVRSDLSQQQTVQKLLPSIASALLYEKTGKLYETESLEAESCAYVVAKQLGIENDYDFDYIADWYDGRSLEELSGTLKLIRDISLGLIKEIIKEAKAVA